MMFSLYEGVVDINSYVMRQHLGLKKAWRVLIDETHGGRRKGLFCHESFLLSIA